MSATAAADEKRGRLLKRSFSLSSRFSKRHAFPSLLEQLTQIPSSGFSTRSRSSLATRLRPSRERACVFFGSIWDFVCGEQHARQCRPPAGADSPPCPPLVPPSSLASFDPGFVRGSNAYHDDVVGSKNKGSLREREREECVKEGDCRRSGGVSESEVTSRE